MERSSIFIHANRRGLWSSNMYRQNFLYYVYCALNYVHCGEEPTAS